MLIANSYQVFLFACISLSNVKISRFVNYYHHEKIFFLVEKNILNAETFSSKRLEVLSVTPKRFVLTENRPFFFPGLSMSSINFYLTKRTRSVAMRRKKLYLCCCVWPFRKKISIFVSMCRKANSCGCIFSSLIRLPVYIFKSRPAWKSEWQNVQSIFHVGCLPQKPEMKCRKNRKNICFYPWKYEAELQGLLMNGRIYRLFGMPSGWLLMKEVRLW